MGRIDRAWLGVFHAEPIKPHHPVARLDNVTLSPHAAFRTPEASENLLRRALDIVRKVQGYPAVVTGSLVGANLRAPARGGCRTALIAWMPKKPGLQRLLCERRAQ